jgi:hypothetical protein
VIVCDPTDNDEVVNDAVPCGPTATLPSTVLPSVKLTDPDGSPDGEVTVAVNVTGSPQAAGFIDEASDVLVTPSQFTVASAPGSVLPCVPLLSTSKNACTVSVPRFAPEYVKDTCPLPSVAADPLVVFAPDTAKRTVRPGYRAPETESLTVAISVYGLPTGLDPDDGLNDNTGDGHDPRNKWSCAKGCGAPKKKLPLAISRI